MILIYDDHVCEVEMWLFWLFLKMKTQRSANVNVNVGRCFFIDISMVLHGAAGFKCPGHLPQRHASGPDVGDGLATSLANVGRCWEMLGDVGRLPRPAEPCCYCCMSFSLIHFCKLNIILISEDNIRTQQLRSVHVLSNSYCGCPKSAGRQEMSPHSCG